MLLALLLELVPLALEEQQSLPQCLDRGHIQQHRLLLELPDVRAQRRRCVMSGSGSGRELRVPGEWALASARLTLPLSVHQVQSYRPYQVEPG